MKTNQPLESMDNELTC